MKLFLVFASLVSTCLACIIYPEMGEVSTRTPRDVYLAIEQPGEQVTIHSARLALEMARLDGQPDEVAFALIRLAHLHFRQGRYNQTRTLLEEVLHDSPIDSLMRCDALRMLGNCAAELGDPDSAEAYYYQAVDLARQLNYRYALYKCLHSLATNIYWPRGQFSLCLAAGTEALSQAQLLNLNEELWFPLSDIAWVYWSTSQDALAKKVADQMEKVVSPNSLGEGFYLCLRAGLAETGAGFLNTVLPLYARARSIAETTGDPGLNVEVRLGLCRSYRAANDLPSALIWAEDAVNVCARLNYRQFLGLALIERGRIRHEKGDLDEAESDFNTALSITLQLNSNFDRTRASLYLAALLSNLKKPEANALWAQVVRLIFDNGYDFLLEQERALFISWIAETLDSTDSALAGISKTVFERLVSTPPAPLQVKTLGQFSLKVGANLIAKENLRQRRAGELLALLLSSPGYTLSAEQVTEAMCPEKEPGAAADFYHHAISSLRRLLEPDLPDRRFPSRYLEMSEERVTLIVPPGSCIDFMEFDQLIQYKDWGKAIALYQGEYLPMYRYVDWAIDLRQQFADQFERALLNQAAKSLADGDAATSLDLARRALLHNPWQEQAVELGMRAALELGDRATAIKLYQRLEKKLEQDLGIAPQVQLQQLYTQTRKRPGHP